MLSGGMDSGSVVTIAKEILHARGDGPLFTFSGARNPNTDPADCAETHAIGAASSMSSISPHLIHPETVQHRYEELVSGNEEPFDGQMMMLRSIYFSAREDGLRLVLDGGAGDVVLGEGTHIVRLLRHGHYRKALAEISGEQRFWKGPSMALSLLRYARAAFAREAAKKMFRGLQQRHIIQNAMDASLIADEFAASVNVTQRFEQMREIFRHGFTRDYAVERCNAIRPNVTGGRERYARSAAAAATEASDPFLDKRVVDYCSQVPGHVRMRSGWPKMILREIMANRLPEEVRWCRGKPHLGWLFNDAVTRHAINYGKLDLASLRESLNGYVDGKALEKSWQEFHDDGDGEQLHSAHLLSRWLLENQYRPVVTP
jgi:asparagine synthase (glutamine-hydrolysing)